MFMGTLAATFGITPDDMLQAYETAIAKRIDSVRVLLPGNYRDEWSPDTAMKLANGDWHKRTECLQALIEIVRAFDLIAEYKQS